MPQNVLRYFNMLASQSEFKKAAELLPKSDAAKQRKEEGKFVELPGAEMGKIVVRFPPEASGLVVNFYSVSFKLYSFLFGLSGMSFLWQKFILSNEVCFNLIFTKTCHCLLDVI